MKSVAPALLLAHAGTAQAPCRELGRDIERQLARWDKHVVWIKIESDPEKLPENTK